LLRTLMGSDSLAAKPKSPKIKDLLNPIAFTRRVAQYLFAPASEVAKFPDGARRDEAGSHHIMPKQVG
jgi:hypothetical protein